MGEIEEIDPWEARIDAIIKKLEAKWEKEKNG